MIEKAENVLELDWILNDPLTEYCKIYLFIFYQLWKFRPMAVRCVVHQRGIKTPGYVWIILIVTRSPPVMEVVQTRVVMINSTVCYLWLRNIKIQSYDLRKMSETKAASASVKCVY